MNIIILGPAHPYRGGIATFNERLAHQMQAEGHTVTMQTFTLQYPSFLFPGKTQYTDEPAPADLKIERTTNAVNPLNWLKVGRNIARRRPDVLVISYWIPQMAPCFGTIARLAARNGHTRVVAILNNVVPHEPKFYDKWLSGYFVRHTHAFVALSRSVLADLSAFDTTKPRIFSPHPLYDHYGKKMDKTEARRQTGLEAGGRYLLFFGFIRDYKGLDLLMQAMADGRIRQQGIKLVVAGEFYGNSQKYFDLERNLGLDSIVWRNDFIADHDIPAYFCAADLVAQTYKTATQSGVTQIAYHFERPMLVTRVGGLPEIVPDGQVGYVTEVDARKIADAVVDFYDNHREETFSANCAAEKQKYQWDKMSAAVLEVARQ